MSRSAASPASAGRPRKSLQQSGEQPVVAEPGPRVFGLLLARQRGDVPVVVEEARRMQAAAEAPEAARPGLGEELWALALINLGAAEASAARFQKAEVHLERDPRRP
jgi:hypothetical protein